MDIDATLKALGEAGFQATIRNYKGKVNCNLEMETEHYILCDIEGEGPTLAEAVMNALIQTWVQYGINETRDRPIYEARMAALEAFEATKK